MPLWRHLTRGLRVLVRRAAADRELDEEVQHYLDEATDAFVASGLSPADARRAALHEVGSAIRVRERVRDHGWENVVSTWLGDVRLSVRMLGKNPVFTTVVVVVVSLGAGAVTTIFSAMNALALRPLPGVARPSELVALLPASRDGSVSEQGSYERYLLLRDHARSLAAVAAWGRVSLSVAVDGAGTSVLGNMVSAGYFDVLGIRPVVGRFFGPDEDRDPGAHPVIVVSHAFWKVRLGGERTSVGRTVTVNGHPFTVIGVAPEGFRGIYSGMTADAWVPLMMQPQLRPRSNLTSASWLWMFGRLQENVATEAAASELSSLTASRAADAGERDAPEALTSVRVVPLTGLPGGERGAILAFMSLLLGAATLVLLIAGVNVATMLSARYVTRQREMAVRAALGAGRGRLLRHLLTEVLILFLLGAAGGFLVALLATTALERLPLPEHIPVSLELSPDFRVLAFALTVSLLGGLVFGLGPALRCVRMDVTSRLHDESSAAGMRRTFLGRALVAGQLAISLVLLVGAGLFLRALDRGREVDPGFDLRNVSVVWLEPESWGYDESRARSFYGRLREQVQQLSGVTAAAYTGRLPLLAGRTTDDIDVDGAAKVRIDSASVGEDYFAVLKLPLVEGRTFDSASDEAGAKVAVVNETLARRLADGQSAVGRTFRFRGDAVTVIGVVRDAKYATLDEQTPSFAYFPVAQVWHPTQALLVRARPGTEQIGLALQQAVLALDPLLPAPKTTTLERAAAIVLLPQRAAATVTGVLGGIGLLLVGVGLYGIMTFTATRRTREIAVRMAMGATRWRVVGMIVADGMRLAVVGLGMGLLMAAAATPVAAPWLFDVNPLDGATFLVMTTTLASVAFVASYLPARRAAAADPATALRAE